MVVRSLVLNLLIFSSVLHLYATLTTPTKNTTNPTTTPTLKPSINPTQQPTKKPKTFPTISPSSITSTSQPSSTPTARPSSSKPSQIPAAMPTAVSIFSPTPVPSTFPTVPSVPTLSPTILPSILLTVLPSLPPSTVPTSAPTKVTRSPTIVWTSKPSSFPTNLPTANPTSLPKSSPSMKLSAAPTASPTKVASFPTQSSPSVAPSAIPTPSPPTEKPSATPTRSPSSTAPTGYPSTAPVSPPSPTSPLPHLIMILTDDLGYHAPGFVNSDMITPNIDYLATKGLSLLEHYTYKVCAPSRAAFLTGRWPYKNSATYRNYGVGAHDGVDLRFTMLPARLSNAGYVTHHIGKWHQGFYRYAYTPMARGFSSTNGFLSGHVDHFTQEKLFKEKLFEETACSFPVYDIWVDNVNDPSVRGVYDDLRYITEAQSIIEQHNQAHPLFMYIATHNVHAPLQAPAAYMNKYGAFSANKDQQTVYAMVTVIDDVVGAVTAALKARGMWNNTVLVWTSDNGATTTGGSNWPLRGAKKSNWEGGDMYTCVSVQRLFMSCPTTWAAAILCATIMANSINRSRV